ncbi:hypothetical protein SABO8233_16025 [Salmonella bongori]
MVLWDNLLCEDTYLGIDVCTGKPYPGYARQQGIQSAESVLNYRYVGNYGRFNGIPPQILHHGYGLHSKNIARWLEQRTFEIN